MMVIRYASSYIDRLFAEQELMGIYHVVSVVAADRQLPEEFWLFSRILEWEGATRSGIWQYYQTLDGATSNRVARDLEQCELFDILDRYRFGQSFWSLPARMAELENWINSHEHRIRGAILELITPHRASLYNVG